MDTAVEKALQERAQKWANGLYPCEFDMDQREWYAVHYTVSTRSKAWVRANRDKQAGQVAALLFYRADPYAVFVQLIRP